MAPKPRLVRGQTPIRTIWMDGWLWWWDGCWVVVVVVVGGGGLMLGSRAPAWSLTSCLRVDPPTTVSLARSPAVEAFGKESSIQHPLKEERWKTINIQMGSFRALKQLRACYKYLMVRIVYVKRTGSALLIIFAI